MRARAFAGSPTESPAGLWVAPRARPLYGSGGGVGGFRPRHRPARPAGSRGRGGVRRRDALPALLVLRGRRAGPRVSLRVGEGVRKFPEWNTSPVLLGRGAPGNSCEGRVRRGWSCQVICGRVALKLHSSGGSAVAWLTAEARPSGRLRGGHGVPRTQRLPPASCLSSPAPVLFPCGRAVPASSSPLVFGMFLVWDCH